MDNAEVEKVILGTYPNHVTEISKIIDKCITVAKGHVDKNKEWNTKHDARFAIYGKWVSALNATRISLSNTVDFISQSNWPEKYNKEFSIGGIQNDFVYMKELDTQFRFANYMSFVSEFEATLLIIIRYLQSKNEKCANNYFNFIVDNLKISSHKDFLRIVKHLRNTVHNNGIHVPDKIRDDFVSLSFGSLKYDFKRNKRVDLTWSDCFLIYNELIEFFEIIIKEEPIRNYRLIKDIVVDS